MTDEELELLGPDQSGSACPVLAAAFRSLNDALEGPERAALLAPVAVALVGSRRDLETELRRACRLIDWAVRVATPRVLDFAGFIDAAERLRALPEIVDRETALAARDAAEVVAYAIEQVITKGDPATQAELAELIVRLAKESQ
jgi:hypothetical protein